MRPLALFLSLLFSCLIGTIPASPGGLRQGLFHSLEVPSNPAREIEQWRRFSKQYRDEEAVYAMCGGAGSLCSPAINHWRRTLRALRGKPAREMLSRINLAVNTLVPYRADGWQPGRKDQWASPLQSIANGGDCEDIAILKYISLMELGFAEKQLRLVVVKDKSSGKGHAVLAVNVKGRQFILDSLTDKVMAEREVTSYLPLYSISGKRRWLHLAYRKVSSAESAKQAMNVSSP